MIAPSRWRTIVVLLSVIFGLVFSLPNVLPQKTLDSLPGFVPKQKLNLGLDLQGGSHLLLEVDTKALRVEKLTNLVEDVRTTLREEKIAFTDLGSGGGRGLRADHGSSPADHGHQPPAPDRRGAAGRRRQRARRDHQPRR